MKNKEIIRSLSRYEGIAEKIVVRTKEVVSGCDFTHFADTSIFAMQGCYSLSSLSLLVNVQVRVMLRTSVSLAMSGGKTG